MKLKLSILISGIAFILIYSNAFALTSDSQIRASLIYLREVENSQNVSPRVFEVSNYGAWAPFLSKYNSLLVQLYSIKHEVSIKDAAYTELATQIDKNFYLNKDKMTTIQGKTVNYKLFLYEKKTISLYLINQTSEEMKTLEKDDETKQLSSALRTSLQRIQNLFTQAYDTGIDSLTSFNNILDFMLSKYGSYSVKDGIVYFENSSDATIFNTLIGNAGKTSEEQNTFLQEKEKLQSALRTKLDSALGYK